MTGRGVSLACRCTACNCRSSQRFDHPLAREHNDDEDGNDRSGFPTKCCHTYTYCEPASILCTEQLRNQVICTHNYISTPPGWSLTKTVYQMRCAIGRKIQNGNPLPPPSKCSKIMCQYVHIRIACPCTLRLCTHICMNEILVCHVSPLANIECVCVVHFPVGCNTAVSCPWYGFVQLWVFPA